MPVILPGQTDIYALTDARLSCGRTLETVVSALLGAGDSCFHDYFSLLQLFLKSFIFFISPSSGSLPLCCSGAL